MIHEYKVEETTNINNVENAKEQAYWQIFCKNYLSEPLAKYKLLKSSEKDCWKVKLRPIVFYADENKGNWHMNMESFVFSYAEALNIYIFFSTKISKDFRDLSTMKEQRKNFLQFFEVSDVYKFIDFIKSKNNSEIKSFPDLENGNYLDPKINPQKRQSDGDQSESSLVNAAKHLKQ